MERTVALTDDQIELLQEFIDHKSKGVYDSYELIPEDYQNYFKGPQAHGGEFKLAYDDGKFSNIEWVGMHKNSKHQRYALHGASAEDEPLLR